MTFAFVITSPISSLRLPYRPSSSSSCSSSSSFFHPHPRARARSTLPPNHSFSVRMSTATRVVPDPLPTVYVYDHCPFCVRVRHVLGMKNVKHNLIWLLNDDVSTPTTLVGRKMVPIFSRNDGTSSAIPESLDICHLIDSDPLYGPINTILPSSSPPRSSDLDTALDAFAMPLRRLTRVRFARAAGLPEFAFADARAAYERNHAIKQAPCTYEENWERSDEWIREVQKGLEKMEKDGVIHSKECVTKGGFSYDDVVVFAKLRALTIVKGLIIPPRIKQYIEWQAAAADIPLYYSHAM